MTERKPKGWGKFDEAMKKLVNVPKGQVDKKIADEQAARRTIGTRRNFIANRQ